MCGDFVCGDFVHKPPNKGKMIRTDNSHARIYDRLVAAKTEGERDELLLELIVCMRVRNCSIFLSLTYPKDGKGFAVALSPMTHPDHLVQYWKFYGFVVVAGVLDEEHCKRSVARIRELMDVLPFVDAAGVPAMQNGFLEVYHDDFLAQARQSPVSYVAHSLIWNTHDLWCTFDRVGAKGPGSPGLPMHVDQSPLNSKAFISTQGVISLVDCTEEMGAFTVVPKYAGVDFAADYGPISRPRRTQPDAIGDYVQADWSHDVGRRAMEGRQVLPLRAGHMVIWDSRTTHGNLPNTTGDAVRYSIYASMCPAKSHRPEAVEKRVTSHRYGTGENDRKARMYASMSPRADLHRYMAGVREPERLTRLGRMLYGVDGAERGPPAPGECGAQ